MYEFWYFDILINYNVGISIFCYYYIIGVWILWFNIIDFFFFVKIDLMFVFGIVLDRGFLMLKFLYVYINCLFVYLFNNL